MDKNVDFKFDKEDRVRIKNEISPEMYQGLTTIGNEAVVKARRLDRYGLPQIYVEWDKNHWTYNGAPDCWTFEDHFDIVEDMSNNNDEPSKQDLVQQAASQFASQMASIFAEGESEANPAVKNDREQKAEAIKSQLKTMPLIDDQSVVGQDVETDEDPEAAQAEALEVVHQQLSKAEAFIVIGVERINHHKAPEGILMPYALAFGKDTAAELLAQTHMAALGAKGYQELALEAIQAISSSGDE